MIEKVYQITKSDEKKIEKVIDDKHVHYMHMILNREEGLPLHHSNANLYMTVVRGRLSIKLDDQEVNVYEAGTILNIPEGIHMDVKNLDEDTLELIVLKTPAPGK